MDDEVGDEWHPALLLALVFLVIFVTKKSMKKILEAHSVRDLFDSGFVGKFWTQEGQKSRNI